jgi:hypothetical protein
MIELLPAGHGLSDGVLLGTNKATTMQAKPNPIRQSPNVFLMACTPLAPGAYRHC